MSVLLVRPPVSELVFQLYGRPLHPELFDILCARRFQRPGYDLRIWITRSGHVMTWENEDVLLTEIADTDQALSDKRRLLRYRLRGEHSGKLACCHGVEYQMSFQVETLAEDIYLHVHDEILADGARRGILHQFPASHRLAIAPLGYVVVDARPQCVLVTTFHTFPDENTIVKSQTVIERV